MGIGADTSGRDEKHQRETIRPSERIEPKVKADAERLSTSHNETFDWARCYEDVSAHDKHVQFAIQFSLLCWFGNAARLTKEVWDEYQRNPVGMVAEAHEAHLKMLSNGRL